jgi:hypothetical protein
VERAGRDGDCLEAYRNRPARRDVSSRDRWSLRHYCQVVRPNEWICRPLVWPDPLASGATSTETISNLDPDDPIRYNAHVATKYREHK